MSADDEKKPTEEEASIEATDASESEPKEEASEATDASEAEPKEEASEATDASEAESKEEAEEAKDSAVDIDALKTAITTLFSTLTKLNHILGSKQDIISKIFGAFRAIKPVVKLLSTVADLKEAFGEAKDLNDTEKEQLIEHFKTEFDLPNDEAEEKIEEVFVALVHGIQFLPLILDMCKKK